MSFKIRQISKLLGYNFGLALDSSGIDLQNINFLYTRLDLLDTDIPGEHCVCLQDVFKTSSRHAFKTFQDMSSRHYQDMPSRRLQDMSLA